MRVETETIEDWALWEGIRTMWEEYNLQEIIQEPDIRKVDVLRTWKTGSGQVGDEGLGGRCRPTTATSDMTK